MRTTAILLLILAFGAVPAFGSGPAAPVIRPDHVVIVVLENKRYDGVIGHAQTPYISGLAKRGANFSNAYGETHPSQPNYLALFSGSTQGVSDNRCTHSFTGVANLATQLLQAGRSFTGYAEGLPSVGWTGCSRGQYVRRHNPWVNFTDVPATSNRPLRDFPIDFSRLPTVSFIVPGLCHDMHDCPKGKADAWLHTALGGYLAWANTHNSILILTFDEDNKTDHNHIPTVVLGPSVRPANHTERIDHYSLLRTIEDWYGLAPLGLAAQRQPLTLA
jgi:phosphatidylinositol-3-phosphatase